MDEKTKTQNVVGTTKTVVGTAVLLIALVQSFRGLRRVAKDLWAMIPEETIEDPNEI